MRCRPAACAVNRCYIDLAAGKHQPPQGDRTMPTFDSVVIDHVPSEPRSARLPMNRPETLNAIGSSTPSDIQQAVEWAEAQDAVHVIIVESAGRAFCAGCDLNEYADGVDPANITADHPCRQEKTPWDPMLDYALMKRHTEAFMSLWRCCKPTIAEVHGYSVAGGSDIALCSGATAAGRYPRATRHAR
jgi:enoyl-CoA hydratase